MLMRRTAGLAILVLSASTAACSDDGGADQPTTMGGSSGAAQAGSSSVAGSTNTAGSTSGGAGSMAGSGGNATAGMAGSGGTTGGTGGSGGSMAGSGTGGAGGSAGAGGAGGSGGASAAFVLTSPDLEHQETCTKDAKETCDTFETKNLLASIGGENQSPELSWGPGPQGTLSYAVGFHDLSNGANGFTHWVVWNIPAGTLKLPANLQRKAQLDAPAGAMQASFQQDNAYAGPGAHGNVYEFKVYALKVASINVQDPANEGNIRTQLEGSQDVLKTSVLRGKSP
jgi:Raf kinase inhibitor-like YbhB/YbcL family protein